MTDAVALLESLDESVRDEPVRARDEVTADDAIAATERVPAGSGDAVPVVVAPGLEAAVTDATCLLWRDLLDE